MKTKNIISKFCHWLLEEGIESKAFKAWFGIHFILTLIRFFWSTFELIRIRILVPKFEYELFFFIKVIRKFFKIMMKQDEPILNSMVIWSSNDHSYPPESFPRIRKWYFWQLRRDKLQLKSVLWIQIRFIGWDPDPLRKCWSVSRKRQNKTKTMEYT